MRGEQDNDKPKQTWYYLHCEGKYKDNGNGGKNCICEGHVFTLETKMSCCPSCGSPLKIFGSNKERADAITCAVKKCIGCGNRFKSAAVNDTHCLGGEYYNGDRLIKIAGSRLCNGCPCAGCCGELLDDVNAMKKYGLNAVVRVQAAFRKLAAQTLRSGNTDEVSQETLDEMVGNNPLLKDIKPDTHERWAAAAFETVKMEMRHHV